MASEVEILLEKVDDPTLRNDLKRQVELLQSKRSFGLVFEDHLPERVRLPGHAVRRGTRVVLRDDETDAPFEVLQVSDGEATVLGTEGQASFPIGDLVVVADFGEAIYPGLRQVESISRGDGRPAHVVINGENHHTLEMLAFTHAGKVDCVYIDPPYNTGGARDWKYNNNYVDENDQYRHSKWLAFMNRRLKLAKDLLNPEGSVLIVAIDENELHRLGLLLQQTFKGQKIQMVTTVVNPRGKYREGEFSRCEEHLFIVMLGRARVTGEPDEDYAEGADMSWRTFRRSDISSKRGSSKGGPSQFYPLYVEDQTRQIVAVGDPLPHGVPRSEVPTRKGCTAVFPVRDDGTEMNWGLTIESLQRLLSQGFVKVGRHFPNKPQPYEVLYLTSGRIDDIKSGRATVLGRDESGAAIVKYVENKLRMPLSTWVRPSHNAETGGTNLVKSLLGDKRFDYPKSLYAVEDTIRYFVKDKREAIVLDFFGGSGTTTHAVMRLNRQDGGTRQCILVTNNEVSGQEADAMRARGLRPGDAEWTARGIFERVTRPRIKAAVTGCRPTGERITDDYRFVDEFPMSEGFKENVDFFELRYLDPEDVEISAAFQGIAPLLWLRAGGRGEMIAQDDGAYAIVDRYGILFNPDHWRPFVSELPHTAVNAFIVTDSQSTFSGIAAELPTGIEAVRLYESYLTTFAVNVGRPGDEG